MNDKCLLLSIKF